MAPMASARGSNIAPAVKYGLLIQYDCFACLFPNNPGPDAQIRPNPWPALLADSGFQLSVRTLSRQPLLPPPLLVTLRTASVH